MAISQLVGQQASGTSSTSSATATYPGATTAGNLLIATAWVNKATDTTAISGWTKAIGVAQSTVATNAIFYKLATGTETTVTVTGGSTAARIHIYEYTGNANPIVLDGINSSPNATSTTSVTGPSITTINANDLLFASLGTGVAITAPTAGNGFTLEQSLPSPIRLIDADQIVSATGTYNATFAWTTTSYNATTIAAFQAASSGGGGTGTASQSMSLLGVG